MPDFTASCTPTRPVVRLRTLPPLLGVELQLAELLLAPLHNFTQRDRQPLGRVVVHHHAVVDLEQHLALSLPRRGDVEHPFKLNGQPVDIAGAGHHDTIYRVLELDPAMLVGGENELTLLSDTEHHGIEVLLRGPALMLRYRD